MTDSVFLFIEQKKTINSSFGAFLLDEHIHAIYYMFNNIYLE